MTEQWEQPPNPVSLPVPWSIGSWKVWQQLIKKGTHHRARTGAATHDRARTRRRLCGSTNFSGLVPFMLLISAVG